MAAPHVEVRVCFASWRNAPLHTSTASASYRAEMLHKILKTLDFRGLFVFLGVKNNPPFTIAPFLEPFGLEPVTFSCHALRDKFPCSVGRHLVQIMV